MSNKKIKKAKDNRKNRRKQRQENHVLIKESNSDKEELLENE
jgi:hypothetical protein